MLKNCQASVFRIIALSALVCFAFTSASQSFAADNEVLLKNLTIIDKTANGRGGKVVFRGRGTDGFAKGPDGNPALLTGSVQITYLDGSTSATFGLPSPWSKNDRGRARFRNRSAPGGPTEVSRAVVIDGTTKSLAILARGLGGIDITNPPGDDGIHVQVTIANGNDSSVHRMCAKFSPEDGSRVLHRSRNGTVKLVMRDSVGANCFDSCGDSFQNGTETDVDCGGNCPACADGANCGTAADCVSNVCIGGVCQVPTCSDGALNGTETDIDCGDTCPTCPDGSDCNVDGDCSSGVCTAGVCQEPQCTDGIQNGIETDTDCGGACPGCPDGGACSVGSDCGSGVCTAGVCQVPTCTDGAANRCGDRHRLRRWNLSNLSRWFCLHYSRRL